MIAEIVRFIIDPFNIFCFLLLVTLVGLVFKKKRVLKWSVIITGTWFVLISTPLIPGAVIRSLEAQYEPINLQKIDTAQTEYHIIILGGGHGFDERMPASALLSENTLRRLVEGIRLYRQLPNSKLILSGFSTVGGYTGAEMQKKAAIQLGVEEKSIILQKDPINTYREAEFYADKFADNHPLILVTSGAHMPRAMMFFKHFGIKPIAAPTDYLLTGSRIYRWLGLPEASNIEHMRLGIKEYTGIFYYRLFIL